MIMYWNWPKLFFPTATFTKSFLTRTRRYRCFHLTVGRAVCYEPRPKQPRFRGTSDAVLATVSPVSVQLATFPNASNGAASVYLLVTSMMSLPGAPLSGTGRRSAYSGTLPTSPPVTPSPPSSYPPQHFFLLPSLAPRSRPTLRNLRRLSRLSLLATLPGTHHCTCGQTDVWTTMQTTHSCFRPRRHFVTADWARHDSSSWTRQCRMKFRCFKQHARSGISPPHSLTTNVASKDLMDLFPYLLLSTTGNQTAAPTIEI